MDYLISKLILMVSGIALSRGRHHFFCLLFFYVWALYKLAVPDPQQHAELYREFPGIWYWACVSAESVIIYLAVTVKPNARMLIIAASTIQILANSVSTWTHALYDFYPYIIRTCEIAQCLTLVIWSQKSLYTIDLLLNRLQSMKGRTWMLRLLKMI